MLDHTLVQGAYLAAVAMAALGLSDQAVQEQAVALMDFPMFKKLSLILEQFSAGFARRGY